MPACDTLTSWGSDERPNISQDAVPNVCNGPAGASLAGSTQSSLPLTLGPLQCRETPPLEDRVELEESARRKRKRSPTRMPLGHDAASSTGAARRYEDRAAEHLRRLGLKPAKTARAAITHFKTLQDI